MGIFSIPELELVRHMDVEVNHVHPSLLTPEEFELWKNIKRIDRTTNLPIIRGTALYTELFPSDRSTMLQSTLGGLIIIRATITKLHCRAGLVFRGREVADYLFDWYGTHRAMEMERQFDREV